MGASRELAELGSVVNVNGGNVGIGTGSPTVAANYRGVIIQGSTTTAGGVLQLQTSDSSFQAQLYTDSNGTTISSTGNYPMRFQTNGSERARIDSSGNLLVGGTANTTGGRIYSEANSTSYYPLVTNNTNSTTTSQIQIDILRNSTRVGSISTTNVATAYNTSSDYRLKYDIAPMTGALAKVSALKPCTYRWKADGSDGEGFIAHELQAVVQQCVTGEKDAVDENGNPVYQGIDTSFLVATLTAAIQELKAEVDQLRAELAAK